MPLTLPQKALAEYLTKRGWALGTTLENRAARLMSRLGLRPDEVTPQHRLGRYRIDFAFVDVKVALELDGWHHKRPEGLLKDSDRDDWMRAEGWLVFRIGDVDDEQMYAQLARVLEVVNRLRAGRR